MDNSRPESTTSPGSESTPITQIQVGPHTTDGGQEPTNRAGPPPAPQSPTNVSLPPSRNPSQTSSRSANNPREPSPSSTPRIQSTLRASSSGPSNDHSAQLSPPPATSPTSPQARNRGYSLRRQLFSRTVSGDILESNAGPSSASASPNGADIEMRPVSRAQSTFRAGSSEVSEEDGTSYKTKGDILPQYRDMIGKYKGKGDGLDFRGKLRNAASNAKRTIFRIKDVPPSKDGRKIPLRLHTKIEGLLIDERTEKPYINNNIRSSRYTIWDFFPRQLVAQFGKLANFYFLCVSILQMIPTLSTTGKYTTIVPLLIFISISMGKEGFDDYRRFKQDKIENKNKTKILIKSEKEDQVTEIVKNTSWRKVRVGDIVRLDRDDSCPADLVILSTENPNGIAYVETAALDGETNLKVIQALPLTGELCQDIASIRDCELSVEDPNLDLYNFEGKITSNGEAKPLTNSQVMYRGSILRNTPSMLGIVIFSGEETKIRMNANKRPRIKAPALQFAVNRVVILIVFFVLALTAGHTIGYWNWQRHTESDSWYLQDANVAFFAIFSGYVIMFNTLIPLSLYVSLEIIKLGQMLLLNDIDMYDEKSNTPMEARTSTINEELGQVSYIFTDKTGTLTDNSMVFRKLSIAGHAWLHESDILDEKQEEEKGYLWHKRRHRPDKGKKKASKKGQEQPEASTSTTDLTRPSLSHPNSSTTVPQRKSMQMAHLQTTQALEQSSSSLVQRMSMQSETPRPSMDRLRRSNSVWRSSALPERPQPQMSTKELMEYLQENPHTFYAKKAKMFLLTLALCHTALPETDKRGHIAYQAASPDEVALVKGAQELDYVVIDRNIGTVTIRTFPTGNESAALEDVYQILDVIEFSSKRKRMSIIVRFPNQKICIISKGADSTMIELLRHKDLAKSKLADIERRANTRKSVEVTEVMRRLSTQRQSLQIFAGRLSMQANNRKSTGGRPSMGNRTSTEESGASGLDQWLRKQERGVDTPVSPDNESLYSRPSLQYGSRMSLNIGEPSSPLGRDTSTNLVDERIAVDEGLVFERCLQHIQDFSVEGLRTLMYAYRFLDEDEYSAWKMTYTEATTSLVNRQQMIEDAAETIETRFELAGATAIEDKLQDGVPDAIDKLRRANIKMWMLTGDKRETAINIGHSCRLIKDYSEVTILDKAKGNLKEQLREAIIKYRTTEVAHSVVVIDGATLAQVDESETKQALFFDLTVSVDTVICCRASSAQKAALVRSIRKKVNKSVTLAIGDGANDIAMIQEAHVGIGITGKEGLAAARSSDYSIAQFRFLLKLLLVHGRWNYVRTCKYVLGTFWKEMLFYLTQAMYQRYNGYTGTSFYEQWSLSMFNTLFTSLPVIFMGIFEKDLAAPTLLAVPELYQYNRRSLFNVRTYIEWISIAAVQAVILFYSTVGLYGGAIFVEYNDIFPFGVIVFTAVIILVSTKLQIIEMHNKSVMAAISFVLSVGGWFMFNGIISSIYDDKGGPVYVKKALGHGFGTQLLWWTTLFIILTAAVLFNLAIVAIRVNFWPNEVDQFQAIEQDSELRKRLEEAASNELQQSWNRGSKKTSLELRREHEREREIQDLLDRPRIMTGHDPSSTMVSDRGTGSSTVDTPLSPTKKSDSASVSVVELRERRRSRELGAGSHEDA